MDKEVCDESAAIRSALLKLLYAYKNYAVDIGKDTGGFTKYGPYQRDLNAINQLFESPLTEDDLNLWFGDGRHRPYFSLKTSALRRVRRFTAEPRPKQG